MSNQELARLRSETLTALNILQRVWEQIGHKRHIAPVPLVENPFGRRTPDRRFGRRKVTPGGVCVLTH
jgi:hypothetical protein